MSNLIVNLRLPQLRMRPVTGDALFRYDAWYAENGFHVTTAGQRQLWGSLTGG